MMSNNSALKVEELYVGYGSGPVVHGVSFSLEKNSVAALLGANGAGKSSILKAIAGLEHSKGKVFLDGYDISSKSAAERFKLGLVYVPEGRAIVAGLSVEENLILGSYFVSAKERTKRQRMVFDFFPEISNRKKSPAGLLSGGEQQMLAIGRGLMSAPRVILLDEPSLGLAPLLVNRVYDRLSIIQEQQGISALLVEQSFHVAAKLAKQAWVVRRGVVVGTLDENTLKSKEGRLQAIDAYLGERQEDVLA